MENYCGICNDVLMNVTIDGINGFVLECKCAKCGHLIKLCLTCGFSFPNRNAYHNKPIDYVCKGCKREKEIEELINT